MNDYTLATANDSRSTYKVELHWSANQDDYEVVRIHARSAHIAKQMADDKYCPYKAVVRQ